jgi:hypothetical protein
VVLEILADERTGQAWVVQEGRAAAPAEFPPVTLSGRE